jgi:hypothetical protein
MATHDYIIDNQTTPSFRSDLNNALAAIVTNNSSASAPSTTYAGMWWLDTTNSYSTAVAQRSLTFRLHQKQQQKLAQTTLS